MRFINRLIKGDMESVRSGFSFYQEGKAYWGWFPLVGDGSQRIGLHAFVSQNKITGYYETGERTRTGNLILGKNRFYLFLKAKQEGTQVRGIVLPDPFVLCMGLSALGAVLVPLLQNPNPQTIFYFLLTYCLEVFFMGLLSKSEPKLYDEINYILDDIRNELS